MQSDFLLFYGLPVFLVMILVLSASYVRFWLVRAYKVERRESIEYSPMARLGRSIANEVDSGFFGLLHLATVLFGVTLWFIGVLSWQSDLPSRYLVAGLPFLVGVLVSFRFLGNVGRVRKAVRQIVRGYVGSGFSQNFMDSQVKSLDEQISHGTPSDSESSTYVLAYLLDQGYEVGESAMESLKSIDPGLLENYIHDRRRQPPRMWITILLIIAAVLLLLVFERFEGPDFVYYLFWGGHYRPSPAFHASVFCFLLAFYTAGLESCRDRMERVSPRETGDVTGANSLFSGSAELD